MPTVKQYALQARNIQDAIAEKMGSDLRREPTSARVLVGSALIIVCVIVKLLVDKGVITDAELQAAFATVRDDPYDDEGRA